MDVQDMKIFARVAALQNLSAVGIELKLTPGTISKRIQALEGELGARLFHRNTRSIRITEEGEKLLGFVDRILSEIEEARAAISANVEQPRGRLRISAPVSLGRGCIAPAISVFLLRHPEIDVEIDLTDRIVNVQEDGYDVVIRTGSLADSGLIRKPLAPDPQIIVASPRYLQQHAEPKVPEDLAQHKCLILGDATHWDFSRNGETSSVRIVGRLRSDNSDLLRHAATEGLGIMRISEARVAKALKDGTLRRLLAGYDIAANSAIYALYPSSKHILPKLRVFLNFLNEWFRDARTNGHEQGELPALTTGRKGIKSPTV